tara:strand:- start:1029 stop:1424 length:396 start_codon:yes stop_codon:yes gene_type:complete
MTTQPNKNYMTSEQFIKKSLLDNGLDKKDSPDVSIINGWGWINSVAYNATSTLLSDNPDIQQKYTGRIYSRMRGTIISKVATDDNLISGKSFFGIFLNPKKIKGNEVRLKKAVMDDFWSYGKGLTLKELSK